MSHPPVPQQAARDPLSAHLACALVLAWARTASEPAPDLAAALDALGDGTGGQLDPRDLHEVLQAHGVDDANTATLWSAAARTARFAAARLHGLAGTGRLELRCQTRPEDLLAYGLVAVAGHAVAAGRADTACVLVAEIVERDDAEAMAAAVHASLAAGAALEG